MTMASTKTKEVKKLPALGFGVKRPSIFSGGRVSAHRSFTPPTFRVTQHKGGGGK